MPPCAGQVEDIVDAINGAAGGGRRRRPCTVKCHAAMAQALADHGVDTVFGLIGDANMFLVDSFVRNHGGRFVPSAHETGATLMAIGYAAVTGRVGVATVTLGPGLSNTVSALIEGVRGNTPLVLIAGDAGDAEREEISRLEQREIVTVTGAGFEQVRAPETLVEDLAAAFWRAQVERRPIALNVRRDFQWRDVEYRRVVRRVAENRAVVPASADLDDAIGIIASARRPIVLAGRGAAGADARRAVLALAARLEAPVATTMKAKDLFRGHPHDLGVFGTMSHPAAVDAIGASDCIVAFGASLNHYTASRGTFLRGKRVVQVNLEPSFVGRHARPDAGVVGDPALVAGIMLQWLDTAEVLASGFVRELLADGRLPITPAPMPAPTGPGAAIDLATALRCINAAVPRDRVVVSDGGRFLSRAWVDIDVPDPRFHVYALNYGSIGMGLAEAVGAAVGAPGRPTLLVTGDGGFMLGGLAEFNTAVRSHCDLIAVVCNDGSYGAEHIQFRNRDMDPTISCFEWPDFAPVAQALGGNGVTVRTVGDLDAAVDAIATRDRPLLIDVKLDPDHMPSLPH